jgi:hypothetical protein
MNCPNPSWTRASVVVGMAYGRGGLHQVNELSILGTTRRPDRFVTVLSTLVDRPAADADRMR